MAASTLNSGNTSHEFDTTAGGLYVISATGVFAGATVIIFYSLTATPTDFYVLPGGVFTGAFTRMLDRAPGTKVKVEIRGYNAGGGTTSVNADVTAAT